MSKFWLSLLTRWEHMAKCCRKGYYTENFKRMLKIVNSFNRLRRMYFGKASKKA